MIRVARIIGSAVSAIRSLKYFPLFFKLRRSTMVFPSDFVVNLLLVHRACRKLTLKSGAIVECGTWRGGMSAALMELGGKSRRYLFCDSFAGLPPPEKEDGLEAIAWAANPAGKRYFNNCCASENEFRSTMRNRGFADESYQLVVGFYVDSLPPLDVPPISVLRLDSDWFSSTTQCLEKFWPHVMAGGLVIIDDYYHWPGCRKALHDFLARHERPEAIRRFPCSGFAYIWKEQNE